MVSPGISVIILTKNEQKDLPRCLESVAWSDDVHVLDSGSSDNTCEIASSQGAKVTIRTYSDQSKLFGGDEAAHRNWALRNIPFKYPWILSLDADECVSAPLAESIMRTAANPINHVAFRIQRRDFLMGTWLKHVQASAYYIRLFRPDKVHYERLINPVLVPDGSVGAIAGYLDHFPFSKGMSHWFEKHNSYSTLEARQIIGNGKLHTPFSLQKALTATDFHERRRHQKELFYRLPLRPLLKFMILYVGKGGFLDGRAGLTYALLQAMYEYMIVLKVRELRSTP